MGRWIPTAFDHAMSRLLQHIADFGKGIGVGLFVVVPVAATRIAFKNPDVFAFEYMREVALLTLWAVGIGLLCRPHKMIVGKSGVEFSFTGEPVAPEQAVAPNTKADT